MLNVARICLPIKHIFSCSKIGRNKLHPFIKISTDIFSLLNFKVTPHGQFLNFFIEKTCLVGVDVSCSGFIEAGSGRSLGLRPVANSMGVLPLQVIWVFLTVAALRINWAGVICARVVWSRFFDALSTSDKRNFLNSRTPISARFGHGVCGLVGIFFTLCIR